MVLNGLPLHFSAEQCHHGDGDVGQHEQGEGHRVQHLPQRRGVNPLPLGDGGKDPHQKQHHIQPQEGLQNVHQAGQE